MTTATASEVPGGTAAVVALLRRHWVIAVVLATGVLLRLAMLVALPHPLLTFTDANVYVRAAEEHLFRPEEGRTAGYPLFLKLAHGVWSGALVPVVLQHLMALVGGLLLYVIGRGRGLADWAAAVPAAVWVLSVDWLWLEHQLLTETLATFLLVAALAVATLTVEGRRAPAVGAAVAALALGSAISRPAMFAAVPGVALVVLLVPRGGWRSRATALGTFAVVFALLFAGYVAVQEHKTGFRGIAGDGLVQIGGYPSAAPFARCDRFRVPAGTRSLCQRGRPDARPGSDYYYWDANSPGRQLLERRPDLRSAIEQWADRALAAEAAAIRRERLRVLARLLGLSGFARPVTDQGPEIFELRDADERKADVAVEALRSYYGAGAVDYGRAGAPWRVLSSLQSVTRPPGLLILLALLVTAAGIIVGRRRAAAAAAFAVTGWVPVLYALYAGNQYNWRYVLPGLPLIALAAMLAGAQLLAASRWRARGAAVPVPDPPSPVSG